MLELKQTKMLQLVKPKANVKSAIADMLSKRLSKEAI